MQGSAVCAAAWSNGYRLSADFYLGDRAMRESGFDTSFRFGPFGGSTHHYAPVGLNSLLYRYERDLHDFAVRLDLDSDAQRWASVADAPFVLNDGRQLKVTVSVGVATSQGLRDTPELLLKRADEGVYQAKQSGRNRVVVRAAA